MGYTNYWRAPRVLEKQAFIAFADDCRKICESLPVGLAGASGEGKPEFSQDKICFNGISPNDDHEPFIINRKLVIIGPEHFSCQPDENGLYFDFCKTERKPYDLCVKCCLVLLKAYFPQVKISSDGGRNEEWFDAVESCHDVLAGDNVDVVNGDNVDDDAAEKPKKFHVLEGFDFQLDA